MKLRNLMWGACACILATGCSNDDVAVENGQSNIVQEGGNAYVKVRIAMAESSVNSRVADEGGYEYGEDYEQAIKKIRFAFYYANDQFAGLGTNVNTSQEVTPNPDEGEAVEAYMTNAVIALQLEEGETFPTQVIAFVNIDIDAEDLKGKTISQARELTSSSDVASTDNGFMMTNSTYLNTADEEQFVTAVSRDNFYDTSEAALEGDHPIDIYVERLAAKVTVTGPAENQIEDVDAGYQLSFTPKGFALSGTNTTEYYLKHIQSSWADWDWFDDDVTNHDYRCFWAEDTNYGDNNETSGLAYTNYDNAEGKGLNGVAQYCMENTMTGENAGNYAASTHLLVVGTYSVSNAEGDKIELEDGNFYMFNGTAYQKTDLINRILSDANGAGNGYRLAWISNTDPSIEADYVQAGADAYDIVPTEEDEVTTVTLRLKTTGTYYTTSNGSNFTEITDANRSSFNESLAAAIVDLGTINGYAGGRAYFAVPIQHFGGTQTDPTGSVGVVRNHTYALTITGITGLGEGVFQPDKVIIPDDEVKTYYVAARLNILSWKTVSQSVSFD